MIKYYQNKKTGDIISFNLEIKEINEFSEIQALEKENTLMEVTVKEVGGGVEHKRPYNRKVKELQDFATGKAKGNRECVDCGKIVPPGKYLCKGKCSACYAKDLYRKKNNGKAKRESRVNEYECIDCGEEIKSTLDIDQVTCPKNSSHTMVQK